MANTIHNWFWLPTADHMIAIVGERDGLPLTIIVTQLRYDASSIAITGYEPETARGIRLWSHWQSLGSPRVIYRRHLRETPDQRDTLLREWKLRQI